MWCVSPCNHIRGFQWSTQARTALHYTPTHYYTITTIARKHKSAFHFTFAPLIQNLLKTLNTICTIIRFQYLGKAYKITKHRRILFLTLHYPTFKYVIWRNVKLKHRRKKKKFFKLIYISAQHVRSNLFANLLRLRIPNTYTGRGIPNNISIYYQRKQRVASRR